MKKHTLGYGLSALLLAGSITVGTYGLHNKNETIRGLMVEKIQLENTNGVLNAEIKDVKSANSQLSEKVENLKSDLNKFQDQLESANSKIEKLHQDNNKLKSDLQAKLEKREEEKKGWSTFTATYYDANEQSTGKTPSNPYYGITASGEHVKVGETIAVDPRVIPLGSWVEVKYPDGRVEKRKATDTGGAIKGNKIDIYIARASSTSGKHPVEVRVIN